MIEAAIQELIKKYLETNLYCTRQEAQDIASLVAKDLIGILNIDITDLKEEVRKIREREDRIWDLVKPPIKISKTSRIREWINKVLLWRIWY